MKKYLLLLSALFSTTVFAQSVYQLPNSNFEGDFVQAYKKKVLTSTTTYKEPLYWHGYATLDASGFNEAGRTGDKLTAITTDCRPGSTGTRCVAIKATSIASIIANGVMTTGRIYTHSTEATNADKNYNYSRPGYTDTSNSNENSSFAQPFHGKPDCMSAWVKFDPKDGTKNSVYPYASVNAVIHTDAEYHDPEGSNDYTSIKVAQACNTKIADYGNWQQLLIPFDYTVGEGTTPAYILISFTTNAQPGAGTAGDMLYIDDIEMIYYSELTEFTFNGVKKDLTSLVGTDEDGDGNDDFNLTLIGKCTDGCLSGITTKSSFATTATTYDVAAQTATIVVTANDGSTSTYHITFAPNVEELVGTYTSLITVTGEGLTPSKSVNKISVAKSTNVENTANFTLPNFFFSGMEVGNIELTDVTACYVDGTPALVYDGLITIEGPVTDDLGLRNLPMTMTAKIEDNKLNATLAITWQGATINVGIEPSNFYYSIQEGTLTAEGTFDNDAVEVLAVASESDLATTQVYDFSAADPTFDQDYMTALLSINENATTIAYIPEGYSYSGDNVICGNTCASLAIKDGVAFSAPKDFTATSVTYDRTLTAGEVSTFVLPFAFTPDANTTVAELASVNGTSLVFKPISTSETVANKPYVIKSTNADALKTFSNVNVKATTGATLTTEVDGYKHIGSYETLTDLTGYGYAGGEFVYTTQGTLNPYRTYITAPAGSEAEAFSLVIDNSTTGLDSVSNAAEGANDCYDLSGRRVVRPSKGLYILNGKKVILK